MDGELRAALLVLRERRDWLTHRVQAKRMVGWDTEWDLRERDALTRVLNAHAYTPVHRHVEWRERSC